MLSETDGLTKAVRNMLGDPTTEILKTKKQVLGDGIADAIMGGEGLQLCSGVAQTKAGDREFEIVTKTSLNYPDGASLDSWLYWKREALAYNSGWLDNIPAGLRAPRCFGVEFIDDSAAVIYMEAVKNAATEWTMDTYAMAGQALGRFSGGYLDKSGILFDSWMAPGRAFSWVDVSRETLDNLTDLKNDPILSRWLSGSNFKRTLELLDQFENLRAALLELPIGLCHHDAFKRNLIFCEGANGKSELVAIDWAFIGPGVVGEDLAANIGASLQLMEVGHTEARFLERIVFDSYIEGLQDVGWSGAQSDVRFGFTACTSMMFALGALGPWRDLMRDPKLDTIVQTTIGTSRDEFIDNLSILQSYFLDLGEEAVSLIGSKA